MCISTKTLNSSAEIRPSPSFPIRSTTAFVSRCASVALGPCVSIHVESASVIPLTLVCFEPITLLHHSRASAHRMQSRYRVSSDESRPLVGAAPIEPDGLAFSSAYSFRKCSSSGCSQVDAPSDCLWKYTLPLASVYSAHPFGSGAHSAASAIHRSDPSAAGSMPRYLP